MDSTRPEFGLIVLRLCSRECLLGLVRRVEQSRLFNCVDGLFGHFLQDIEL